MEIIAYCNNSCCPSIIINEKDQSQPVLIKDDYQGSIPLTLQDFDLLTKHINQRKRSGEWSTSISDREFLIFFYETDNQYFGIKMIDATGNTRKVRDITFEHWEVFEEAIAKHYAVA